jgi:hypothetical protein
MDRVAGGWQRQLGRAKCSSPSMPQASANQARPRRTHSAPVRSSAGFPDDCVEHHKASAVTRTPAAFHLETRYTQRHVRRRNGTFVAVKWHFACLYIAQLALKWRVTRHFTVRPASGGSRVKRWCGRRHGDRKTPVAPEMVPTALTTSGMGRFTGRHSAAHPSLREVFVHCTSLLHPRAPGHSP